VINRIRAIEQKNGIRVYDINNGISINEICEFSRAVSEIADRYGIEVYSCAEAINLEECGIKKGCCIDGKLIKKLFNIEKNFSRDKNQRPECLCSESFDMGVYNTCRFNCTYCYANYSDALLNANIKNHFKESPAMVGKYGPDIEILRDKKTDKKCEQISIF
jgi:hypothetical protein